MKHSRIITQAALIAALYTVLTLLSATLGLANGAIQIRISEALTVLPYFTFSAVPGLFIGCLISNLLTGAVIWDIIFGSIATLIGAVITYLLKRKNMFLSPVGPIISNTLIIPFILSKAYNIDKAIWIMMISVGIGEIISCGILGMILLKSLQKYSDTLFK